MEEGKGQRVQRCGGRGCEDDGASRRVCYGGGRASVRLERGGVKEAGTVPYK